MVISLKSWRQSGGVHGHWGWIHTALVMSLFQWTAAQLSITPDVVTPKQPSITPDVVTAAVGDNVTLSLRHEGRLINVAWFRGEGTGAGGRILTLIGSGPLDYGSESTGRETALQDGSLRITDLQAGDTGTYTVQVCVSPGVYQEATAQLTVHAPEAGGNTFRTITPMTVSVPERGAPPAAATPCTSWWVTLAVASGMLVSAALVVLGVVLFYERRLKKVNGATPGGNRRVIYEPAVKYENVENGNRALTAARSSNADHTYMALMHGDQATYGHLQRPEN